MGNRIDLWSIGLSREFFRAESASGGVYAFGRSQIDALFRLKATVIPEVPHELQGSIRERFARPSLSLLLSHKILPVSLESLVISIRSIIQYRITLLI